jgi:hypothetical protein
MNTFAAKTFASGTFRCGTLAGAPGRGVAYYVAAGEAAVTGAVTGQHFHTGASAGLCHG